MKLLDTAEWDFTGVPDSELYCCHRWEFCRESPIVRDWIEKRTTLWRPEGAGLFTALICRKPDGSDAVLSKFPGCPWQRLSPEDRAVVLQVHADLTRPGLDPFRLAMHWDTPQLFDVLCETAASPTQRADDLFHDVPPVSAPDDPGTTVAAVAIEWSASDAALVRSFKAWLNQHRPQEGGQSVPRVTPKDLVGQLTCLGIARIARTGTPKRLQQAYNGKFKERLAPPRIYIEVTRAEKAFRSIFGQAERPLFRSKTPLPDGRSGSV